MSWRGPLVLVGTVAGVIGVLTYRTPQGSVQQARPGTGATSGSGAGQSASQGSSGNGAGSSASGGGSSGSASSAGSGSTGSSGSGASGTVTVQGAVEDYGYGALSVDVTFSGRRITNVSVASLQVAESLSQQIADAAVPQLRQEVLDAQSAQIAGVSGATFTSQAYAASVQSAIDRSAR
ncbi:FMN-binding protein [Aciditerrimonas ferrireducens]|jgi:uncharacterized protein with FMN-binding domain|uniref:FMN-binding protein n=1 Tax=Aciditerrimonas ferrireducens TaxID=667306 RepID=A0ABV6C3Q8_9ACTN|nr:FMN-binding protein [Aciditerrimonas ferrireducens]MCK4177362.1 FMN-binding protein [Aciditerrimonas ferrireducens]